MIKFQLNTGENVHVYVKSMSYCQRQNYAKNVFMLHQIKKNFSLYIADMSNAAYKIDFLFFQCKFRSQHKSGIT